MVGMTQRRPGMKKTGQPAPAYAAGTGSAGVLQRRGPADRWYTKGLAGIGIRFSMQITSTRKTHGVLTVCWVRAARGGAVRGSWSGRRQRLPLRDAGRYGDAPGGLVSAASRR